MVVGLIVSKVEIRRRGHHGLDRPGGQPLEHVPGVPVVELDRTVSGGPVGFEFLSV
jgi:hypothetical protein